VSVSRRAVRCARCSGVAGLLAFSRSPVLAFSRSRVSRLAFSGIAERFELDFVSGVRVLGFVRSRSNSNSNSNSMSFGCSRARVRSVSFGCELELELDFRPRSFG